MGKKFSQKVKVVAVPENAQKVKVVAVPENEVPDLDSDEPNANAKGDQALVPVDMNSGRFVIDDEVREIMQTIPAGVNFTCFMDCCYSGTITRMFGVGAPSSSDGSKARFIHVPAELAELHTAFRKRQRRRSAAPTRLAESMRELSFSACQPKEAAYETQGQGDFTRRAVALLKSAVGTMTNQEFCDRVIREFGSGRRQTPMLDGADAAKARKLLEPLETAPVPPAEGDALAAILRRLDAIERRLEGMNG